MVTMMCGQLDCTDFKALFFLPLQVLIINNIIMHALSLDKLFHNIRNLD